MRWNTSKGFLRPVKHRRNLDVETDAMVERLVLDGKRVTGLVMRQHGSRRTIRAAREVVLAAGAIGSPQIMQLSGIGPGAVLQPFGIEVRHELKGVGENLQDHLQVRCAYKVQGVKTMNERFQSLVQRAGFAAQYVFQRRGPMTMAPSQLGAFVKSDPSRETPNLQYHVQPLTLPKFGEPLDPFPAFTASVANIRPTSRGWVRITAPDPEAHPEIRPNYLATQDDRRVAADGDPRDAQHRLHAVAGEVQARRNSGRASSCRATRRWRKPPATSRPRSFTRSAPARWAATTPPWSIPGSRCTDCRDCASPMPPSCRPSPPATPTRRR